MKIRTGFVSNSSSSSFLIDGEKYTEEMIRKYISLLLEARNYIKKTDWKVDYICTIHKEESPFDFDRRRMEFYSYPELNKDFLPVNHNGPVIIIDSINDNSIPWEIQYCLEEIAILRQYWG